MLTSHMSIQTRKNSINIDAVSIYKINELNFPLVVTITAFPLFIGLHERLH